MSKKSMPIYKLDVEEQELSDLLDNAVKKKSIKSVPNVKKEIKRITGIFKENGNKNKRVSLRMTENDFYKAQEIARQEGLPYQTFLSSIFHKYLSGRLVEKKVAFRA
jgi:predicted DNA binding CopG/RHH family protein